MRFVLVAVSLCAIASTAHAASPPLPSCLAMRSGVSRVAVTVADPAQCCNGRLRCAQFLSTNRVVRPANDQHI